MKNLIFICIICGFIFISGCKINHNFMDVDNPNPKGDFEYYFGSGKIPEVDGLIPQNLSGARKDAKGYADKYYQDNLEEYVDMTKEGLSGAKESLKGYYNNGVDELNKMVSDKVNGAISGELNKFKIK